MSKVDNAVTAETVFKTAMQWGSAGYTDMAKLHGVKEHLINLFTFGIIHAGRDRVAAATGLIPISTGFVAAMGENCLVPDEIATTLKTADGMELAFTVGKEAGELAGQYRLNLRWGNERIKFSLMLGEREVTFDCSEDQFNAGLKALCAVNMLQQFEQRGLKGGTSPSEFIKTGEFALPVLAGADLTGAHLEHADLRGAHLNDTVFGNARLNGTKLDRTEFSKTANHGSDSDTSEVEWC